MLLDAATEEQHGHCLLTNDGRLFHPTGARGRAELLPTGPALTGKARGPRRLGRSDSVAKNPESKSPFPALYLFVGKRIHIYHFGLDRNQS